MTFAFICGTQWVVRTMGAAAVCVAVALASPQAIAQSARERVQVTDPYLEMRTGPGRGYPIQYVASRHEWVELLLRHTDWYKVRTANGREGWVNRSQLVNTIAEAGGERLFRDIVLDDYLNRKVEFGAAYGLFKSEPFAKLWANYRLAEPLTIEATVGQVQGVFSGTDLWHVNLNLEPWSDRRLSPFFGVGFGRFKNIPNASLVDASTVNAKLGNATIGLRYHLTDRFIARVDYSIYSAFVGDTRSIEYRAGSAGIAFFFY